MPDTNEQLDERRAYLLDVSLFIFEFLSPEKLVRNYSKEGVILEVPSAFVTMIWSSMTGSNILQNLIYAYLIGLRNNGTFAKNTDERIRRLAKATDEELQDYGHSAYDNIVGVYAQLIDGATKQASQENFTPLISRYEPILPNQPPDDLVKMRNSYIEEFGIPAHPLYDLYFLQVYHAQSTGFAASPILKRTFVFVGRKAYSAIVRWVGETGPNAVNLSTQERYKKSLKWFIDEYVPEQLVDGAVEGGLGLGLSFALTGVTQLSIIAETSVASAATAVVKKVVIDPVRESPYFKRSDREILLTIIFSLFGVCICLAVVFWKPWKALNPSSTQSQIMPIFLPTQTQLTTPVVNITSAPTIAIPLETPTLIVAPTLISQASTGADYCLYVVQPGDTLQSVSTRFQVTESDLRASDKLVNRGVFLNNQMIRVNVSCCRPANVNGFSYTVQQGETLYSIARNNAISVNQLATVNNLFDSSYIQAGQMLCVPFQ